MVEQKEKSDILKLMKFIDNSLTSYHAIQEVSTQLETHNFHKLSETNLWKLEKGESYYMTRNDSSMMAFRIPD